MECVLAIEAGNCSAQGVLLLFALLEGAQGSFEKVEILVANGEVVEAGQILMRLEKAAA